LSRRGLYFIRVVGPDLDEIRKVLVVRQGRGITNRTTRR